MLSKLCTAAFPSGSDRVLNPPLEGLFDEVWRDEFQNIIALKRGTSGKKILIDAHGDEIALMVSGFTGSGALKFQTAGGIDARILPGSEVIVHGRRDVFGIIGAKPPHVLSEEERERSVKPSDLTIDVGLKNPQEVISIGDFVTFRPNFTEMEGDFVMSKSLDNRAGLYAAISAVKRMKNCPHDVYLLVSAGEELGCVGARGADINPDFAIVVDVTFGQSENEKNEHSFPLGSGAALCTGPNICKRLFDGIVNIAKRENIPFEIEVEGGDAGTNAGVIQLSGEGVATAMISIPIRYMHTPFEVAKMTDIDLCATLLARVCEEGGGILA